MSSRHSETCLYADGGLVGKNPSTTAGVWAYCVVGPEGRLVREDSGSFTPADIGLPICSSNVAELMAVVAGLESLPDWWRGTIFTDSRVTLCRVSKRKKQAKLNGVPAGLRGRLLAAKLRAGGYRCLLVAGHPSRSELERGKSGKDVLVSRWNVYCDELCRKAARDFLARWPDKSPLG